MTAGGLGPVLFAYDGSDLAGLAIEEAGHQLGPGRDAVMLTVWRAYAVGFIPPPGIEFNAAATEEVERAAEETAAHGASLAQAAGFRAQRRAVPVRQKGTSIVRDTCFRDRAIWLGRFSPLRTSAPGFPPIGAGAIG